MQKVHDAHKTLLETNRYAPESPGPRKMILSFWGPASLEVQTSLVLGKVIQVVEFIKSIGISWVAPPRIPVANEGFVFGSPTKNIIILAGTVTGHGELVSSIF